jgi:hypothetical protein
MLKSLEVRLKMKKNVFNGSHGVLCLEECLKIQIIIL